MLITRRSPRRTGEHPQKSVGNKSYQDAYFKREYFYRTEQFEGTHDFRSPI